MIDSARTQLVLLRDQNWTTTTTHEPQEHGSTRNEENGKEDGWKVKSTGRELLPGLLTSTALVVLQ